MENTTARLAARITHEASYRHVISNGTMSVGPDRGRRYESGVCRLCGKGYRSYADAPEVCAAKLERVVDWDHETALDEDAARATTATAAALRAAIDLERLALPALSSDGYDRAVRFAAERAAVIKGTAVTRANTATLRASAEQVVGMVEVIAHLSGRADDDVYGDIGAVLTLLDGAATDA